MSSYSIQQWTISRSDSDVQWSVDFICQLAMTSAVVRPRRSSKVLPKTKLAPKRVCGHCLMVCWQSDPLQLSESQRNHYIWNLRSANQWDAPKTAKAAASIGQQKGPILHNTTWLHDAQPTLQKRNELSSEVLPHPLHAPDLLPNNYHCPKHLNNFLQGKHFHNQQETEMLSKSSSNPKAQIFTL